MLWTFLIILIFLIHEPRISFHLFVSSVSFISVLKFFVYRSLTSLNTFIAKYIVLGEKAVAPHSSTLAWKTPWTEEPGRLQSMGSLRIRHDWTTSLSLFTFMHWRGKWQPTPVFLPGESQGRGSPVGCHLWVCTELDMTETTQQQQQQQIIFDAIVCGILLFFFFR